MENVNVKKVLNILVIQNHADNIIVMLQQNIKH